MQIMMNIIQYLKMISRKRHIYLFIFLFFLIITNFNFKFLKVFYLILINENEVLSDFNYKYAKEFQDFINNNKIREKNESLPNFNDLRRILNGTFCPFIPPKLIGEMKVDEEDISIEELNKKYENTFNESSGGHWKPKNCQAFFKVAIIVPYRDRDLHLKLFLNHMHKILPIQQIDYSIYIIEQVSLENLNQAYRNFSLKFIFISSQRIQNLIELY
jgi:hypothetical protein